MSASKPVRRPFQSIELDPDLIDRRLEAKAAENGIPTLVTPRIEEPPASDNATEAEQGAPLRRRASRGLPGHATQRDCGARMQGDGQAARFLRNHT